MIHPHEEFDQPQEFSSNDNGFKISLPTIRAKYSATPEWTDKFGLFEEDGFNEYGVAMSATESTYTNKLALGADPLVEDGIGEEAMITVVLPYVKTAREGVQRLGQIVEYYGTSESNGILFADQNEAWYMETGGGHNWVAQRIPDDSYAVIANQSAIQGIDFDDPKHFMWSTNIRKFVADNHLNPIIPAIHLTSGRFSVPPTYRIPITIRRGFGMACGCSRPTSNLTQPAKICRLLIRPTEN